MASFRVENSSSTAYVLSSAKTCLFATNILDHGYVRTASDPRWVLGSTDPLATSLRSRNLVNCVSQKNLCFWRLPWRMTRLSWLIDDVQTYCDWFQVHSVPSLYHRSLKHQLTKFFVHVIKFISKMAAYILSCVISWCIFRRLSFVWATNDTAKNKQRFTTLNLVLKNQSVVQ